MAIVVQDYLLDQGEIHWPLASAEWSWLLPPEFTLLLVNRFCDLFLVPLGGSAYMLDIGLGTLTKLAESRDDFFRKIDEGDNAADWLMIPLVDQLVAAGLLLRPGECYGFKLPPALGGQYQVENCGILPIHDYLGANGSIHRQLRDVPDGSQVVLKVVNKPA